MVELRFLPGNASRSLYSHTFSGHGKEKMTTLESLGTTTNVKSAPHSARASLSRRLLYRQLTQRSPTNRQVHDLWVCLPFNSLLITSLPTYFMAVLRYPVQAREKEGVPISMLDLLAISFSSSLEDNF